MTNNKKNHEWLLEGIDCANCAAKIEQAVGKIEGVTNSSVNFMTKTLQFEVDRNHENETLPKVKKRIAQLEPGVIPLTKQTLQPVSKDGVEMEGYEEKKEESSHHDHSHSHGHSHGDANIKKAVIRLVLTIVLLFTAIFSPFSEKITFVLYVLAYIAAGYDVVMTAVKNIMNGQVFDENFLMTIATMSAFYIQQYPEAVAVMLFYQVGELFQDIAVDKSRRSIAELMDIRPDYANLKNEDGSTKKVDPESIEIGDTIIVQPGEKVPLDGKVVVGSSTVDTAALTGESIPRKVAAGEQVLSGFINQGGLLEVEVEKIFKESTVVKILDLVENASGRKAPTENFITKFARYYTPIVVVLAVLLAVVPPLLIDGATFNEWLYRASIFLVISCPCALVVSIPVGFFGGIGSASRKGILVKGSNFLEGLNDLKYVVMDKTGTVTKGKFEVGSIYAVEGYAKEEILEIAALAEQYSTHPIASSIKEAYGKKIDPARLSDYEEVAGHGVQATIDSREVLVGNSKLLIGKQISFKENNELGTIIYVAVDGSFIGSMVIGDQIKEDAKETITQLHQAGVEHIVMLTGDSKAVAESVAKEIGIKEVYAELLPQDKVAKLEEIMQRKQPSEKVAFVGDGINDTPVLARSDIGFAMGGLGSDAAIEAADIVIMDDQPSKIAVSMKVAKETRKIVWQNIIFAMAVKGIFLLLGAFGVATMWEAVFADVGVTVLAVLNAMRIINK